MVEKALAGYAIEKRPVRNSGGRKFTLKLKPIYGEVQRETISLRRTYDDETDDADLAMEARLARVQKLMDEVTSAKPQDRKSKRKGTSKRK